MQLLGGETAEHYRATDYDLAGFCTGIVEKNDIVEEEDTDTEKTNHPIEKSPVC